MVEAIDISTVTVAVIAKLVLKKYPRRGETELTWVWFPAAVGGRKNLSHAIFWVKHVNKWFVNKHHWRKATSLFHSNISVRFLFQLRWEFWAEKTSKTKSWTRRWQTTDNSISPKFSFCSEKTVKFFKFVDYLVNIFTKFSSKIFPNAKNASNDKILDNFLFCLKSQESFELSI